MKKIWDFCRAKKWIFAAFLIPLFLLFIAYAAAGTFPFGERSVLVLDLAGQYVWYLERLRDICFEGGSFFYALSRSLGGEFLGIFAYYLASPFSFLILLFPKSEIQLAVYLILLLKTGCSGFGMFFYLQKKFRALSPVMCVALSSAYALCGYSVAYQNNLMWTDALILLPFVICGLESLLLEKKWKCYTIALTLTLLCNYYIGYMVGLFALLYFFFYHWAHPCNFQSNSKLNLKNNVTYFIVFSFFSVLFSSFVWLPGIYALTLGKIASGTMSLRPALQFSVFDFLRKLLPGTYDTLMEDGLPFVYCGLLILLLLPLYFFSPKYTRREKICRGTGMALFVCSMWLNLTDRIWHGFRSPNCLNYRYAFLLCFLMITTAAAGLAAPPRKCRNAVLPLSGGLVILALISFFCADRPDKPAVFLTVTLVSLTLTTALLLFLFSRKTSGKSLSKQRFLTLSLSAVLLLELTANATLTLLSMDDDLGFVRYESFKTDFSALLSAKETILESDSSLYRTETTERSHSNENMGVGLYGVSGSTSTLHASSLAFLENIGYPAASHWSSYVTPNPFTDSLLGIKYLISEENLHLYTNLSNKIYRNDQALSLCYRVSGTEIEFGENAAENCNALAKCLTASDFGNVFSPISGENYFYIGGTLYDAELNSLVLLKDKSEDATAIVFTAVADKSGDFYFLLPAYCPAEVILTYNGKTTTAFDRAEGYWIYLGNFSAGDTLRIQLTFAEETEALTFYRGESHFYHFSAENCNAYLSLLSGAQVPLECLSESRFDGSFETFTADETYLLTLPFDPCLMIRIDGKRVDTFAAFQGLTAFTVTDPGIHTITIRYVPISLDVGIGVSVAGTALFVLLLFLQNRKKNF